MSNPQPEQAVLVWSRDLFFRAKLEAVIRGAGCDARREATRPALAVIELAGASGLERVRELAARGVPVLAFGSHVDAAQLRAARAAGAEAVPNSAIERVLRERLEVILRQHREELSPPVREEPSPPNHEEPSPP